MTHTISDAPLVVDRNDYVAEVTMHGTGSGNLLGPALWEALPEVFAGLDADADVRAVVLVGAGDVFTYGLDLPAMFPRWAEALAGGRARPRTDLNADILRLQAAITAIAVCRKPVIAAVCGHCIGGGVDIAAAADIRLASADASFSIRQTRLGIVPDLGVLQRLAGIIGEGHLRQLAFTGEEMDADRAERIGLVNAVHPDRKATLASAHALAKRIAGNPPLVVQGVKDVLGFSRDPRIEAGMRYLAAWNAAFLPSDDLDEALSAYRESRPATFEGC